MALVDLLKHILGAAAPIAGQTLGGVGRDIQQTANPAVFAQNEENARQSQSLAQQLQMHQADRSSLSLEQQVQTALQLQQQVQQQGNLQQQRGDSQTKDLIGMMAQGATQGTSGDPGAFKYGGKWIIPPTPKTYTIDPESDAGKELQIETPVTMDSDTYVKTMGSLQGKRAVSADKEATNRIIEAQKEVLAKQINQRFSRPYYQQMYGSDGANVSDSEIEAQRQMHLANLENAAALSKRQTNTTSIEGFGKDLASFQSPQEKRIAKEQDFAHQKTLTAMMAQQAYENKYPLPDEQAITDGVKGVQRYGLKYLQAIHGVNPRMAVAVEQAAAKQGLTPANLTNDSINNGNLARISIDQLTQAENLLNQPGMADAVGPVLSRYKAFMAGDVGKSVDQRVKTLNDKLKYARATLGKVHYTARGAANENIQHTLSSLFDGEKMDAPTLLNGIANAKNILREYAEEGQISPADNLGIGGGGGMGFLPVGKQ